MYTLCLVYVCILPHTLITLGSPSDNPASYGDTVLIRTLTYFHYWAINAKVMLVPTVLLADYAHGTIPLVTSLLDSRNAGSAVMLFVRIYLFYIYI